MLYGTVIMISNRRFLMLLGSSLRSDPAGAPPFRGPPSNVKQASHQINHHSLIGTENHQGDSLDDQAHEKPPC